MKFDFSKLTRTTTTAPPTQEPTNVGLTEMTAESDGVMDRFQSTVYNDGIRLMKEINLAEDAKSLKKAISGTEDDLRRLKDFHFRVGFAGAQSAGKSTVINSLLDYPLSPTCTLCTTANVVSICYGKTPKLRVRRCSDKALLLEYDCRKMDRELWNDLLTFACRLCEIRPLENLIYFTDRDVRDVNAEAPLKVSEVNMDRNDPRQVAMLLLAVLSVYINREKTEHYALRSNVFKRLRLDGETEYDVEVEWNSPLLSGGMIMVDLPGLGSAAEAEMTRSGILHRSHDDVTIDAINSMDAMVFLIDKQVAADGLKAVEAMISKASIKSAGRSDIRIIPVINKCDIPGSIDAAKGFLSDIFKRCGIEKSDDDIIAYSSIYCEHTFPDIPLERTMFYRNWMRANSVLAANLNMDPSIIASTLTRLLKESYEGSGIALLKKMFVTKCVELGKYIRTLETMQSLRNLAIAAVSRMDTLEEAYGISGNVNSDVSDRLKRQLVNAVNVPVNAALQSLSDGSETKGRELGKSCRKLITADIPARFVECCNTSLKDYSGSLIEILGKFSLDFTGNKARIDVPGSPNAILFSAFNAKVKELEFNTLPVDALYKDLVADVKSYLDEMCECASQSLSTASDSIRRNIDDIALDIELSNAPLSDSTTGGFTSPEDLRRIKVSTDKLKDLSKKLVVFINSQFALARKNINKAKVDSDNALSRILNEIHAQTDVGSRKYRNHVVNAVSSLIDKGLLLENRTYLHINASVSSQLLRSFSSGLAELFNSQSSAGRFFNDVATVNDPANTAVVPYLQALVLNSEDADMFRANIAASGQRVLEAVSMWTEKISKDMSSILLDARGEMIGLIEAAAGAYSAGGEKNRDKAEKLRASIKNVRACCGRYADSVGPDAREAAKHMADETDETSRLVNDPMYGLPDEKEAPVNSPAV